MPYRIYYKKKIAPMEVNFEVFGITEKLSNAKIMQRQLRKIGYRTRRERFR